MSEETEDEVWANDFPEDGPFDEEEDFDDPLYGMSEEIP